MAIRFDVTVSPKVIMITSPTTEVTVQELVNAIREWEDDPWNMSYQKVIDAVGKADLGGGVVTGITMTLSSDWQIQFWAGVGYGIVKDGNIVGGYSNQPIKATGGSDTILQLGAVGATIVTAEMEAELAQLQADIDFIKEIEGGRWKLLNNQMIFYEDDNVTEVARFNLFDENGLPTMSNVMERVRV